jgi:hypothetical protein
MIKPGMFIICFFVFFSCNGTFAQEEENGCRITFWNVENLFDPFDDSLKLDDEFTPGGNHGWTWIRFNRKLNNIYKVIMSAGWEPPDIIGLCEVENRWVLERLTRMTPLSKFEYRIIHKDSPDLRGIDVAMLYISSSFRPLEIKFIPVTGLKPDDDPTRDILKVKGIMKMQDTVNMFVNHWPSRYIGQTETMHKRHAAASELKRQVDSLFVSDPCCKIIIMGDFNDEPWDESISETLDAVVATAGMTIGSSDSSTPSYSFNIIDFIGDNLYCLIPHGQKTITGTLKYEGRWYLFDQFMISGGLLAKTRSYDMKISDYDFLLEPDDTYTGRKPFRTYNGYIYKGGYSDHLPVILDLSLKK